MTDWMAWFGVAGILVILEMFTGTFYLLMLGLGFLAGGFIALAGGDASAQMIAAGIVGVFSIFALRRSKWSKAARRAPSGDPNMNFDIGQTLMVEAWSGSEGETRTARAMYRGALWDVELEPGAVARSGLFVIREVRGSRLVVANSGSK